MEYTEEIERMLERLEHLANQPIDALKTLYTAAAGISTRSAYDDKQQTKGMTRGALLRGIIAGEFFELKD